MDSGVTGRLILLHCHFDYRVRVTIVSIDVLVDIKTTIAHCKVRYKTSRLEDIWQHGVLAEAGILVSKALVDDCTLPFWW